jgi:tyrosinase
MSVNLGPLAPGIPGVPPNPDLNGLGYNPRCLRRDINPHVSVVTADNYTASLITKKQNKDIYWFQTDMQGKFDLGEWGVHTGGHFSTYILRLLPLLSDRLRVGQFPEKQ